MPLRSGQRPIRDDGGVTTRIESHQSVAGAIDQMGQTFAVFDARTQDSGHISYGVLGADGHRWFVKTGGDYSDSPGGTTRASRVEALRRAAAIQDAVDHPVLVPLEAVVEAADGVLIVHAWFEGELLRSPAEKRDDPDEAFSRFRALPVPEIAAALDAVIDVHVALERAGWVAGDFYDGCLMYDFGNRTMKLIDLEAYHRGPYLNDVGRLPGSTRFMAPEEHTKGALIDARTTVYNLGRMLEIFLTDQHPHRALGGVTRRATADLPERRQASVAALQAEWRSALEQVASVALPRP
jgi:serine/threonine-protein kinase